MQRRTFRIAGFLLVALLGLLALSASAGAAAGTRHVALGEGKMSSLPYPCPPTTTCVDPSLSIAASDDPGALGHAQYTQSRGLDPTNSDWWYGGPTYAAVTWRIAFTCVVITDIAGGHTLDASGLGIPLGLGIGPRPEELSVVLTVIGTSAAFNVLPSSHATTPTPVGPRK